VHQSVLRKWEHDFIGADDSEHVDFFHQTPFGEHNMVATLDRLLALARKLHDAEVRSESEPIYVSLDLNEVRLLTRLAADYVEQSDTALYEREGSVFA
jgi:hypothetical protein